MGIPPLCWGDVGNVISKTGALKLLHRKCHCCCAAVPDRAIPARPIGAGRPGLEPSGISGSSFPGKSGSEAVLVWHWAGGFRM